MNRVNAPDGTPLVYDTYEPSAPTSAVLMFHDWAATAEEGAAAGAQLRDAGYAAYAIDLRGHGRSGGRRVHLSRFSQLLGDLQAFRRAVRRRHDVPQVLLGHGFGALVVLRYLETQPGEPPAAAVLSNPWLASRRPPAAWKRLAARLADLWPTFPAGRGRERMTAGARAEIQWAQQAVQADHRRIERPLLFVLSEDDNLVDSGLARRFAEDLDPPAEVRWYRHAPHDVLALAAVVQDVVHFVSTRSSDAIPRSE